LDPSKYTLKWQLDLSDNPKIMLMVNFTTRQENVSLQVSPIQKHWRINDITNLSQLSILDQPVTMSISGSPPEPAAAVD
jgi:hypothetical protein